MTDQERIISYNEAAKQAGVHRNTIITWVKQDLLHDKKIAGHPTLSEHELTALLDVRKGDPRNWQKRWRQQQAARKEGHHGTQCTYNPDSSHMM